MRLLFIFLILLFIGGACNREKKFDKVKWSKEDDFYYPFRDGMVNDLLKNYPLIGHHYQEIHNLLGHASDWGDDYFSYQIIVHYSGADPEYEKDLKFTFNKDSIITDAKIIEYHEK